MSKLSKLRGGASAPVTILSNNVESSVSNVFARMQGQKAPSGSKFPAKKAYVPSRFRCQPSETKRLVILDEKFSFGMREHSLKGPDGKWTTERCISEWDTCPLCTKENVNVYDVALLTVNDLTPWSKTNQD